jgi:hypothetical protein
MQVADALSRYPDIRFSTIGQMTLQTKKTHIQERIIGRISGNAIISVTF